VLDTAPHLDTLGIFARTLDLLVAADAVLTEDSAVVPGRERLAIGLCRSPVWDNASAEMQTAFFDFAQSLRSAGHLVEERELASPFTELSGAQALIHRREAWMELGHIARDHPEQVSPEFLDLMEQGAKDSEADYHAALEIQRDCQEQMPSLFAGVDMLLVPGARSVAPEGIAATGDPVFQRIWTALGVPCLGFPVAWRADGLPLGLQIIGAAGADRQLLADAHSILVHAALREPF
jgi:amidase